MAAKDEWKIASTKKMVAFGFGYIVINYLLSYGLVYLLYFYENIIKLSAGLIMFGYVIFAIWNMVNDPLLGYFTDKPRKWTKKYGLRAPWVILATVPMLILYIFIWTPPAGDPILICIWFILLTCLFDAAFSIYNEGVYAGYTNQFPSEYERRKSFALMTFMMGIGLTLMSVLSSILLSVKTQATFLLTAIVMVVILVPCAILQIAGVRESEEMKKMFIKSFESGEEKSFVTVVKTALKQKNFLVSLAGYTCQVTATAFLNTSVIYMFQDVYGLSYAQYVLPQLLGMVVFCVMVFFWAAYAKKHGFKKTYWVCFILHGVTLLPLLFIPGNLLMIIIVQMIFNVFYSGEVIMLMPVAADTYDEVALALGRRQDATFVGIRNFFFRVAFLLVGVLIPLIHIMTGYVPTTALAAQNPIATFGVRVHTALIPAIIFIVMGLIFRQLYTLDGAEKQGMVKKLKEAGLCNK